MTRLTDEQVMVLLKSDAPINRARGEFAAACGIIDQAGYRPGGLPPIEMRRLEFEAIMKIVATLGVEL